MLRITLVPASEPPTLKLEGKLTGPWVGELEHSWSELSLDGHQHPVTVDLTDVTFISPEGKKLLRSMLKHGTDLQSRSLMTQFILSQIKSESNGKHESRTGG
jgi:anti-anti-sigma regulatory factor